MAFPRLTWDMGTAYDLFVSLVVLHRPGDFGVRASWAAGVRSRLPSAQREFLEKAQSFLPVPLAWVYGLPAPRSAAVVLERLSALPAVERLPAVMISPDTSPDLLEQLHALAERRKWQLPDLELARAATQHQGRILRPAELANLLDAWAGLAEFGDAYLAALRTYVDVFFSDEEERIRPVMQAGLARAQAQAAALPPADLLDVLSQGVRFEVFREAAELILAPSYWGAPLVFFAQVEPGRELLLFGSRPADHAIVPGEAVPEPLLNALKALADPTRLRILRYLAQEPMNPTRLALRLRLRPPTMIHHLRVLRLAGLVQVILESETERRYAARPEALAGLFAGLSGFITSSEEKPDRNAE